MSQRRLHRREPRPSPKFSDLSPPVDYPCRSSDPGPNYDPNRAPQHPYRHLRRLCSRAPPRATGSAAARTPLLPRPHDLHQTVHVNRAEVKPEKITVSSGSFAETPLRFAKMNPRSTLVDKIISKPPLVLLFRPLSFSIIEPVVQHLIFCALAPGSNL